MTQTLREKADEAISEAIKKRRRADSLERRVSDPLARLRSSGNRLSFWEDIQNANNARSEAEEAFQEAVEAERMADQEHTQVDWDALNVKGIDAYKGLPQEEPAG